MPPRRCRGQERRRVVAPERVVPGVEAERHARGIEQPLHLLGLGDVEDDRLDAGRTDGVGVTVASHAGQDVESPASQFAVAFGSAPRPTASSNTPSMPPDTTVIAWVASTPAPTSRSRATDGSSGMVPRSSSTHSAGEYTSTRSGSGK